MKQAKLVKRWVVVSRPNSRSDLLTMSFWQFFEGGGNQLVASHVPIGIPVDERAMVMTLEWLDLAQLPSGVAALMDIYETNRTTAKPKNKRGD